VSRGQLPQRAGLSGLNGSGAAAAVPLMWTVTGSVVTLVCMTASFC